MRLSRHDAGELARLESAQMAKNSAEEVLHPPGSTPRFATPAKLKQAWADEQIVAFPQSERVTGLRADAHMGELGAPPTLYQGLRPEALATALYIGAEVRAISKQSPLIVTSTVRDDVYQRRLVARNREATRNYSLHTTGWAFDIARKLPLEGACAGVPVRPRPPAGARCDRVGSGARRHPRDGRSGGEGPAPSAQAGTTRRMTDAIRTPDPLLEGLPDYPYEPGYRTVDGLRLAHVDEGDGRPVVMFHGEPTWGYLWRHLLPPLRDAGHRVILPDLPGFGRSDKPMDRGWYSYDRHVAVAGTLLEDLDIRDATFVVHDWGGPIGLRLAVEHPDRVARLVIMDTGLFTGQQPMSDAWHALPRLRRAHRGPADRHARAPRLPHRPRRRGRRRLRRAVPQRGREGRGARVPAA